MMTSSLNVSGSGSEIITLLSSDDTCFTISFSISETPIAQYEDTMREGYIDIRSLCNLIWVLKQCQIWFGLGCAFGYVTKEYGITVLCKIVIYIGCDI